MSPRSSPGPAPARPCPPTPSSASDLDERRQLQLHPFLIEPSPPVDRHRQRQLPAVFALQGRQGFAAARFVLDDTPGPLAPIPENTATAGITRGEAHPARGAQP